MLYTRSPNGCVGFAFQILIIYLLIELKSQRKLASGKNRSYHRSRDHANPPRTNTMCAQSVTLLALARITTCFHIVLTVLDNFSLQQFQLCFSLLYICCQIAKILTCCTQPNNIQIHHKIQVRKLECLIPQSTESLQTVNGILHQ